jgi:hypothetical protein
MSALLTEATRALGAHGASDARTAAGAIVIAVLLLVLVMREMARTSVSGERAHKLADLRPIVVPLSLVFLAVLGPRLADLVR